MEHGELTTTGDDVGAERTRRAVLALWAIPGLGSVGLGRLTSHAKGDVGALLDAPVEDWLGCLDDDAVAPAVKRRLKQVGRLAFVAEVMLERAHRAGITITYPGDTTYPDRLIGIPDQPPVLFMRGSLGRPRRRVAMVGTRRPDNQFRRKAHDFAAEAAMLGLGIVSGAAVGIDQACHRGALSVGGETWGFVGSALDQLDPSQATLEREVLEKGGAYFSELPPGVRANTQTFPRRNRLISGASDGVLVLRARAESGTNHTVEYAEEQGRKIWALTGDFDVEEAKGPHALLATKRADICIGPRHLAELVGAPSKPPSGDSEDGGADIEMLSEEARAAYRLLRRSPQSFEDVHVASGGMTPGALLAALVELELFGFAVQRPGKFYEKV